MTSIEKLLKEIGERALDVSSSSDDIVEAQRKLIGRVFVCTFDVPRIVAACRELERGLDEIGNANGKGETSSIYLLRSIARESILGAAEILSGGGE